MKSLKTSLAIVLVVILASCAKQLPKPSKEVKSILVIPAEVVNKTQIDRKFDYVFFFKANQLMVLGTGAIPHNMINYLV